MKLSVKMKKLSVAILTMAMTFGCAQAAFSGSIAFLDVSRNYWAYDDIAFAAQNGIVNGYYQEWTGTYTFAPENAVTYEEAATMLYRTLAGTGQVDRSVDTATLVAQYKDVLDKNGIALWAQEYVAYMLDKNIIGQDELSSFVVSEGVGVQAPRMTVAVWTAKALGAEKAPVMYLPYADISTIDDQEAEYVDMLYRYGIMKGSLNTDGTITFNGDAGVKRSEFAAVSNRVYKLRSAGMASNAADIFSYSGDELKYLRYDDDAAVIVGGKESSLTAEKAAASSVVVAGMVLPADTEAQIHFYSEPFAGNGTIKSMDKLSDTVTRVGVAVSGDVIYYIIDAQTDYIDKAKISVGTKIAYIADGVKLVEIQQQ